MQAISIDREVDRVESELATLAAHVDAATHRLLELIRRFDALGGWAAAGARSCAHWLSWRIGLAPGAAREKVRVASALGELPRIDDALRRGELSYAKVRAMTRVATADNEEALLHMAMHATAAQLEKICRGVRRVGRLDMERAHADRAVGSRQLESGLVRVTLDLLPDEAATVLRAIDEARRVPAETRGAEAARVPGAGTLVAGTPLADRADGAVRVAEAFLAGAAGGRRAGADRFSVVVELRPDALDDGYRAELDDGACVPAETFRRIACDCRVTAVAANADGTVTGVGRQTRVVSARLVRALALRDPCCRFPGCTNRLWLDTHHIEHWAHRAGRARPRSTSSPTSARYAARERDELVFRTPAGIVVDPAPRPDRVGRDPVATLLANQRHLAIHDETGLCHWDGRVPDYRACVEAALPSGRA